jgi:hypothetical protein
MMIDSGALPATAAKASRNADGRNRLELATASTSAKTTARARLPRT